MKNIIIRKTMEYGNKGEMFVEKNGKIEVEVVSPDSLREIIEYAKNNFYSLKDVTLDEENFSFKYGEYKVTFEFYKSHAFIRDNIKKLKNNKPEMITFKNRRDMVIDFGGFNLIVKEYDSYLEISNLLSEISSKRQNIMFHIKGDNLYTKVNGIIIELKDYKKFSFNRNFRYIFEKIQLKKIKIVKDTILIGGLAILTTIAGVIVMQTNVGASDEELIKEAIKEPESKIVSTQPIPSHTSEEMNTVTIYVDSEPETLSYVSTSELSTEVQTTSITNDDKYAELGIGSSVNDEKAVTARHLYYDLIEKYASKYGLDPELVLAVATQERGIHSNQIDKMGAIGLMQVQVEDWENESLTVFDYDQGKEVTIVFTMDKISSLEGNIESGCVILSHYINLRKGNVIAGVQTYNNGPGTMDTILGSYSRSRNKSVYDILLENDLGWLKYRSEDYPGDYEYAENVFRYYAGDIRNLEPNNGKAMS